MTGKNNLFLSRLTNSVLAFRKMDLRNHLNLVDLEKGAWGGMMKILIGY